MKEIHPNFSENELKDMYNSCHGTNGAAPSKNFEQMKHQGMMMKNFQIMCEVMIMMGGMMSDWGMMGFGIFGWILNLFIIGLVVYFTVKLALPDKN